MKERDLGLQQTVFQKNYSLEGSKLNQLSLGLLFLIKVAGSSTESVQRLFATVNVVSSLISLNLDTNSCSFENLSVVLYTFQLDMKK